MLFGFTLVLSAFFQLCFSIAAPASEALKQRFCFKHVLNSLSTSCNMSLSFCAFLSRARFKQVHKTRTSANTLVDKFPASDVQGVNF